MKASTTTCGLMMKYSLPFPLPQSLQLVDKLRGYKTGFTADEWRAHTLYILPEGVFWVGLISVLLWIVSSRRRRGT